MAVRAADVAGGDAGAVIEKMGAEEGEPADVFRRLIRPGVQSRVGRRGVLTTEAIPGRIIGDERCLVKLDGNPEEEREIVPGSARTHFREGYRHRRAYLSGFWIHPRSPG